MSKKITVQQNQIYKMPLYDYIQYYPVEYDTHFYQDQNNSAIFYLWTDGDNRYAIPVSAWDKEEPPNGAKSVVFIQNPELSKDDAVLEDLKSGEKSFFCSLERDTQDWEEETGVTIYLKGVKDTATGKWTWNPDAVFVSNAGSTDEPGSTDSSDIGSQVTEVEADNIYYVTADNSESGLRIATDEFCKMAQGQKKAAKAGALYVAKYCGGAYSNQDSDNANQTNIVKNSNNVFSPDDTNKGDIIDFTIKVPEETPTNSTQYWGQLIWQIGVDRNGTQVIPYLGTPFHIFKYFHWSVESFGENLGHKLAGNYKINKPYALTIYRTKLDSGTDKPVIKRDSDYAKQRGWWVATQGSDGKPTEDIDNATSIPNLYNISSSIENEGSSLPPDIQVRYTVLTYDD